MTPVAGCTSTRCACWTTSTWNPTWRPALHEAIDHLCDACREHFDAVRRCSTSWACGIEIDHALVRGLDYYTRTTFEFYVAGREGQQQALGGGGRYDGLVEALGGRPRRRSASGSALDRTVLAMQEQDVSAARSTATGRSRVGASDDLRFTPLRRGLPCAMPACVCGRMAAAASSASSSNRRPRQAPRWAVIVGDGRSRGARRPARPGRRRAARAAAGAGRGRHPRRTERA